MKKLKFTSVTLAVAIALSSTAASAGNKRHKPVNIMQDASSATAAQRSGATLQGGSGGDGGAGVGG